jgi:hypothetical protein
MTKVKRENTPRLNRAPKRQDVPCHRALWYCTVLGGGSECFQHRLGESDQVLLLTFVTDAKRSRATKHKARIAPSMLLENERRLKASAAPDPAQIDMPFHLEEAGRSCHALQSSYVDVSAVRSHATTREAPTNDDRVKQEDHTRCYEQLPCRRV